jgi:hypothetical protein
VLALVCQLTVFNVPFVGYTVCARCSSILLSNDCTLANRTDGKGRLPTLQGTQTYTPDTPSLSPANDWGEGLVGCLE